MDKKLLSSKLFMIILLEVIAAVLFVMIRISLLGTPQIITFTEFLVLDLFILGVILNIWVMLAQAKKIPKQILLTLSALILIFSIVIYITNPAKKSYSEAKEFTYIHTDTTMAGFDLGEKIVSDKVTAEQVQELIDSYPKELQQTFIDAVDQVIEQHRESPDSKPVLKVPTVPVNLEGWTCNQYGCSYADQSSIWTISRSNLYFGNFVAGLVMLLTIWIINTSPSFNRDPDIR